MTRDSENITLGGYTNRQLDKGHISLRGEYAKGSDLFVSLHTNANADMANGYPTYDQPVEINKPIIIVNRVACESQLVLNICNSIGENIAELYDEMDLYKGKGYRSNCK